MLGRPPIQVIAAATATNSTIRRPPTFRQGWELMSRALNGPSSIIVFVELARPIRDDGRLRAISRPADFGRASPFVAFAA